jgi:dihydroorotate dehydrogenase electron transfer subunit
MFADVADFHQAGCDVHLATLDGSAGLTGTVVDLLDKQVAVTGIAAAGTRIACCGPEPMMAAVSRWAATRALPCAVSLETPMACGIGICFTCVAPIRDAAGGWDYRRTCVEGPIFDSADVVW